MWPAADLLYACDGRWWAARSPPATFGGIRLTQDQWAAERFGLGLIDVDPAAHMLLLDPAGPIGSGGNSGFQALNIAVRSGARRIALVGFDLGGRVHWHGRHGLGLKNPTEADLATWARHLDAQAPLLSTLGVEVINTSPRSALQAFPCAPLTAALN